MQKKELVIVGNGPVAHKFIETMIASPAYQQYAITVIGEEPNPAYNRVYLTAWFESRSIDSIAMGTDAFYAEHQINCVCDEQITEIDRAQQQVLAASGNRYAYDVLVLATGSYPFVPPVSGHDRDNTFVYRTIEDLADMTAAAESAKIGTVVGGGLLGLEAAKALHDLGLETHVVEFAPRLMAVQVDDGGGAVLREKIEALGVGVHTQKNTQQIVDGEHAQHRMEFADGESLETDMIVFSAGIRPQDALARQSELEIGERGGIVINNVCQTSDPNIYAIGECALWNGRTFGLIAPCNQMAVIAAEQISGDGDTEFTGFDMSTKLKLMGVDVGSIGDAHANTPGAKVYTYLDQPSEVYKKIVVSPDNQKLLGAVLVGDTSDYDALLQYALNGIDLPEHPDTLILPSRDGSGGAALGVDMLPDSAVICSCNNVSKGDINAAVQAGNCTIGDIKACTGAATSCGGCAALATQVMNAEMENLGMEVNTDLCEHFPYTRQEIFHLIRVEKIKSFAELIGKYGKGSGCDICRPTVGSILASCWNDYILEDQHQINQDTNDYFMGNMQKDGTYSIVPRMAGGEVTPDKLIVLGQVAKEYDLYTKVTGGQRIDLFGARQEQLPEIWKKLIDAGFETGHAYGKSVRTVKSCVGSTWCRYGVDDSVGFAIEIENRYKGLRSPHKLKFAVSGCTRECAEAQSKDIGVIATENGWNLYTCGNGGMKPRHADLFAADLDRATLIKYIDRILMFYVRTADRLQRTSVWFENLEGGLDYLRDVVIEDKLGICAELEEDMQRVVDSYQCEWKTTIEDPEKVKRFDHFVNSDLSDDNVVFVKERGQIRPATDVEKQTLIASAS
ncbi:MAG: nitrite reductase large subunit [Pseudomonadales bacterium]|nr:nitrite reductase large subunit [Pseudomonadales bacterium]